jgi:upstream activation factor subunit UAF30
LRLPAGVIKSIQQISKKMASAAKLRTTISEILETADLTTITAKKVRQHLEEQLDMDLADRKKEIDGMVMEILEEKQGGLKRKGGSSSEEEEEEKPKKRGRKAAASDSDSDSGKKKKPAAKPKKAGGGTGFTKTCKLSPELSSIMGSDSMARHEVVKKMWAIIKEKNLYDPKNKQFAICNAELLPVFGVKRFRTFGMMKYLKTHFVD